ncbi:SPOR domain-containing protein [Sphingorhabdus sp.]|uniref:SPOR domain-containing protein n=1 Tax=Sphingorhabdus sp. TaxID=1902408 RepID=UPI00391C934C
MDSRDDGLNLDDNDRLPWLETADGYEVEESGSPLKVAFMVVAGLVLLAAIVGGIYWIQRGPNSGANGTGELIAAPKGSYKEKPADAGGKSFEGEGDSAFAASEGQKTGAILAPAPPEPVAVPKPAAAAPAAPAKTDSAPANAVMVQLGAFGDSAKAETAWSALNKRFGFLAGMNRKIAEANVEGGRTVFRLQAITANSSEAQQLCAKLKAAGENCLIVR